MEIKLVLNFLILNILLVYCLAVVVGTNQNSDPNVPDESDMDVINDWVNSNKNNDNNNQNPDRGSLEQTNTTPVTTTTSTVVSSTTDGANIRKNEKGEPCRCVKYYLCEVGKEETTTTTTSTTTTIVPSTETPITTSTEETNLGTESSQNILGVVDIRGGFSCPDVDFDVCCPLKNIKEEISTTTTTTTTTPPTPSIMVTPSPTKPPSGRHRCGIRNENGVGSTKMAASSQEALFGEFPWTVAIINLEQTEDNATVLKYVGGGSLLHPQVVLTVAHNVLGKSRNTLKVRLGEWDTQTNDEPYPSQDRGVKKVIVHEIFLKKTLYNDVALLILDEEARFAPNVDTICLPPVPKKGGKPLNFDGQLCYSAGWGKDQFGATGRFSDIMKKVIVPVVPHDKCDKELQKSEKLPGFRLDKSFMCAGGSESGDDTCKGDGGSALACSVRVKEDGGDPDGTVHYVQAGAVSWGLGCKSTVYPGVYADIQYLTPWILKKMEKEDMSTEYCTF